MSEILMDFQACVHTYEISQPLTKKQFKTIYGQMCARDRLIHNKKGGDSGESYVLLDEEMPGITITLYRPRKRQIYWVSVKIELCKVFKL